MSVADKVDRCLERLAHEGLLPPEDQWQGCNESDLFSVRAANHGHVPDAYSRFLARIGRCDEPRLFLGSDVFRPYPTDLRTWTDELLAENGLDSLPPYAVPILLHQGYIAFWTLGMEADQPVWCFSEGRTAEPEPAYGSFTERLLELGAEWSRPVEGQT
ncbi:MAG: hypothetical protein HYX32_12485 [Actinobacteria bacterium]|nr:hypothetical protein [Actinomycetota bacterium]